MIFNRATLDEYLAVTDSVLVTAFDFTHIHPNGFGGWHETHQQQSVAEDDLFYRSHIERGYASYLRGVHIVRSATSKEAVIKRLDYSPEEREYASFIAWDFKNGVLKEISTAPTGIANYFTKSDLPFETSPAFFRPEVLLKIGRVIPINIASKTDLSVVAMRGTSKLMTLMKLGRSTLT